MKSESVSYTHLDVYKRQALDYVTLPEDFASVASKRSDVEPTSEEVEEQISDLLSQYSSTEHITDRAAADGDTVNIN